MTDETLPEPTFAGFPEPKSNYCRVPNELFAAFPEFTSMSELMVVLYVLRHTWGFQDFEEGKRISVDEFMHGRKRRDGSRLDDGIGMSAPAVRRGIRAAVEHGFLEVTVDDTDKARVRKYYQLKMVPGGTKRSPQSPSGGTKRSTDGTNDSTGENETLPRTEKETFEKNYRKREQVPPNPIDADAVKAWRAASAEFRKQFPRETYDKHVRFLRLVAADGDTLTLEAMTESSREWLAHQLDKPIRRTLSRVMGREVEVIYEVKNGKQA